MEKQKGNAFWSTAGANFFACGAKKHDFWVYFGSFRRSFWDALRCVALSVVFCVAWRCEKRDIEGTQFECSIYIRIGDGGESGEKRKRGEVKGQSGKV